MMDPPSAYYKNAFFRNVLDIKKKEQHERRCNVCHFMRQEYINREKNPVLEKTQIGYRLCQLNAPSELKWI